MARGCTRLVLENHFRVHPDIRASLRTDGKHRARQEVWHEELITPSVEERPLQTLIQVGAPLLQQMYQHHLRGNNQLWTHKKVKVFETGHDSNQTLMRFFSSRNAQRFFKLKQNQKKGRTSESHPRTRKRMLEVCSGGMG